MNDTNNIKTALLMPDSNELNNFQIKNIILRISKKRNSKQIAPLYI